MRKSPFYVGSADGSRFDNLNPDLGTYPAAAPNTALYTNNAYNVFIDAGMRYLFPKDPANPKVVTPYVVGCA